MVTMNQRLKVKFSDSLEYPLSKSLINSTVISVAILRQTEQDNEVSDIILEQVVDYEFESYEDDELTLRLNLTDPEMISQGDQSDVLIVRFPNENLTMVMTYSLELDKSLHSDYFEMSKKIPLQIVETSFTKKLDQAVEESGSILQTSFIINLLLQQILDGVYMRQLVSIMTLILHLPMTLAQYPAISQKFIAALMPFVLFDFSDSSFGIIDIQNFITFYEYGSDEID